MDKTKFTMNPDLDSEGFIQDLSESGQLYDHNVYVVPAWIIEQRQMVAKADSETEMLYRELTGRPSPWSLLDQDHLDRIHHMWVNSAPAMQRYLESLHVEAIVAVDY